MLNKLEELRKDIIELESLEKTATRQKVKDILSIEKRKIVSEIVKIEEQLKQQPTSTSSNSVPPVNRHYEVKLNNYAWDQTSKFVKFYVTLNDVHTLPAQKITCIFTPNSVEMKVSDLGGKNYVLTISNLLKPIKPSDSTWKSKTDMIIISASKAEPADWPCVTAFEKKTQDAQKPKLDGDKADPSDGLMSLMKDMYDKGDDEMKRTIAKAWTESQMKNLSI